MRNTKRFILLRKSKRNVRANEIFYCAFAKSSVINRTANASCSSPNERTNDDDDDVVERKTFAFASVSRISDQDEDEE